MNKPIDDSKANTFDKPDGAPKIEERGFVEGVAEGFATTMIHPFRILRALLGAKQ
jgi:hypothetical protein